MNNQKLKSFISLIGFALLLSCNETVTEKKENGLAAAPGVPGVNVNDAKDVESIVGTNKIKPATQTVVERLNAGETAAKEEKKAPQQQERVSVDDRLGKYGCVASKYRNGEYEFIPRGSVILKQGGNYSYLGFEEPSTGKFEFDAMGNIDFHEGYLKDGKAEKTDREGKYLLTFPSNPDNRWTMSFVE